MKFNFKRKEKGLDFKIYFKEAILGLIVVGFISLLIIGGVRYSTGNVLITGDEKTCGDGTFYNSCSLDKPYFCDEGILKEKASICGCPENMYKEGEFCASDLFFNFSEEKFYYILNGKKDKIYMRVYGGVENYTENLPRSIKYSEEEVPKRRSEEHTSELQSH